MPGWNHFVAIYPRGTGMRGAGEADIAGPIGSHRMELVDAIRIPLVKDQEITGG